jgi:hypothetical protein
MSAQPADSSHLAALTRRGRAIGEKLARQGRQIAEIDAVGKVERFEGLAVTLVDREKQRIAAVSRTPNNLDLFVIGFDNHVWSAWWSPV